MKRGVRLRLSRKARYYFFLKKAMPGVKRHKKNFRHHFHRAKQAYSFSRPGARIGRIRESLIRWIAFPPSDGKKHLPGKKISQDHEIIMKIRTFGSKWTVSNRDVRKARFLMGVRQYFES